MKILVFSDVHANLTALEAVLADAGAVDAYWFLGDLVGYGPDPAACIARVHALPRVTRVLGNHDAAVLGQMPLEWFNSEAQRLILWTREQLSEADMAFLAEAPEQAVFNDITLVHGSPRAPVTEYILTAEAAAEALKKAKTDFCFVGHTHQPVRWQEEADGSIHRYAARAGETVALTPRAVFNVGSVGQPRDGDPRAAYALYDTNTHEWTWRRTPYDVKAVQQRMDALGLSPINARRLSAGR